MIPPRFKTITNLVVVFQVLLLSAQGETIEALEDGYKRTFGIEKLKMLNQLTDHFTIANPRKGIKYGKLAVQLGEALFSQPNGQISESTPNQLRLAYFQLGRVMLYRERYYEAKTNLELAIELGALSEEDPIKKKSLFLLDSLSQVMDTTKIKQGLLSKTIGSLRIGEVFNNTTNDVKVQAEIKLGNVQERKGNFLKAVGHYEKAINLLKNRGD
ncbi:MAG: hypothetical protein AAGF77_10630 [Bacteroidota bacterium]